MVWFTERRPGGVRRFTWVLGILVLAPPGSIGAQEADGLEEPVEVEPIEVEAEEPAGPMFVDWEDFFSHHAPRAEVRGECVLSIGRGAVRTGGLGDKESKRERLGALQSNPETRSGPRGRVVGPQPGEALMEVDGEVVAAHPEIHVHQSPPVIEIDGVRFEDGCVPSSVRPVGIIEVEILSAAQAGAILGTKGAGGLIRLKTTSGP